MRTAVVNWTSRHVGGAETYLGQIIPALRLRGDSVFFWHEQNQPADRNPIACLEDSASCDASQIGVESALRTLERWQPDVLYAHGLVSPDVEHALLALAPAVFFAHGYYGTCISGSKTVRLPVVQPCDRTFGPLCLLQFYPRRCGGLNPVTMITDYARQSARLANLRRYRSIATFSEHMRREYLKHGFDAGEVHVVPPIVAPYPRGTSDPVLSQSPVEDRASGTSTVRLAFIGRMDVLKGVGILLRALAGVREMVKGRIVLTIAGDGPDMERSRQAARETAATLPNTDVVFLGWISRDRCDDLLDESDVLVVPSLWPEPFGLVGLEALQRGIPVAAFAVGGIPEWLEDGRTGALAPADPPTDQGLAAAIVRCLTSRQIHETVEDRARRNSCDRSTSRHLEALIPILAAASSRHPLPNCEPIVSLS